MDVVSSWLQLIGLVLDLLGFSYLLFDGWLSHQKMYDAEERAKLEENQFEDSDARETLSKPLILKEAYIVWRRESFMSGCAWIIIGFLFQIIAAGISGTFFV